uniref:hypothetical protein n=1 Tax=Vibrio splendidus TaxID=29497 RepID=UPI003F643DC3
MPAYKSGKKTQQYPTEFKVTAVRLSLREGPTVKSGALSRSRRAGFEEADN